MRRIVERKASMFLMTWRLASAKLQMCQYLPCSWLVELLLVNVMLMEVWTITIAIVLEVNVNVNLTSLANHVPGVSQSILVYFGCYQE